MADKEEQSNRDSFRTPRREYWLFFRQTQRQSSKVQMKLHHIHERREDIRLNSRKEGSSKFRKWHNGNIPNRLLTIDSSTFVRTYVSAYSRQEHEFKRNIVLKFIKTWLPLEQQRINRHYYLKNWSYSEQEYTWRKKIYFVAVNAAATSLRSARVRFLHIKKFFFRNISSPNKFTNVYYQRCITPFIKLPPVAIIITEIFFSSNTKY